MKIYIIAHKKYKHPFKEQPQIYKTLTVGVSNGNISNDGALKDNVGENISEKNKSFCELTGLYWLSKNISEDIVGIDHYRRYFVNNSNQLLDEQQINQLLKNHDIILPKKAPVPDGRTIGQYFSFQHDPLVWAKTRDFIKEKYPEFVADFDWVNYQKEAYLYNMLICKKDMFDQYCHWLFNILFELEENIDIGKYDSYNQRMFGFLSERLINVWVHHQNLNVSEQAIDFTVPHLMSLRVKNKLRKIYLAAKITK